MGIKEHQLREEIPKVVKVQKKIFDKMLCSYETKFKHRSMEKPKYNNHEVKNSKHLGHKIVTNGSIKGENTEVIKNAGKFYHLVRAILLKLKIPKNGDICLFKIHYKISQTAYKYTYP